VVTNPNHNVMWRWIVSLFVFAGCASLVVRTFVVSAILQKEPWVQMHWSTGWLLAAFTIGWVVIFTFSLRRFGKKVWWALIGFPFILYWDVMWLLGLFFATTS
jgi:hypothetical protein